MLNWGVRRQHKELITMGVKTLFRLILIVLLFSFSSTSFAQDVRKYKCIATYNHGEEMPADDYVYYIEFDYNKLTRWVLRDGKWKYGKVFEQCEEYNDGTKVYLNVESIISGSSATCSDLFRVSPDRSSIYRSYRCMGSEYEFDYVFQEIE